MTAVAKWQRVVVMAVAIAVTCGFFINFCDLAYRCGCTFLWAGAADHCNVHHGPKRCPWCVIGDAGQFAVWLWIAIPQALASFWPNGWRWPARLALALIAFPVMGGLAALAVGLWYGYWN